MKSTDHDSMSGEHVGTTLGLNVTSGKSGIWSLATPENQGFVKLRKFPRGKYLGTNAFGIYNIWEEEKRCLVCWGKIINTYCYEQCFLSVR